MALPYAICHMASCIISYIRCHSSTSCAGAYDSGLVGPRLLNVATGGVWNSFVLLPRILGCWGSFARAFLPGRLVFYFIFRIRILSPGLSRYNLNGFCSSKRPRGPRRPQELLNDKKIAAPRHLDRQPPIDSYFDTLPTK